MDGWMDVDVLMSIIIEVFSKNIWMEYKWVEKISFDYKWPMYQFMLMMYAHTYYKACMYVCMYVYSNNSNCMSLYPSGNIHIRITNTANFALSK